MNLRTAFLTVSVFALAAACTPAAKEPAPAAPVAAPIAEAAPPSGPAAENTTDSLSSTPACRSGRCACACCARRGACTLAAGPTLELTPRPRRLRRDLRHVPRAHRPGHADGRRPHQRTRVAVIKEKITKGMVNPGDKMPPMGAALSADQLDALAKFVAAGLPA